MLLSASSAHMSNPCSPSKHVGSPDKAHNIASSSVSRLRQDGPSVLCACWPTLHSIAFWLLDGISQVPLSIDWAFHFAKLNSLKCSHLFCLLRGGLTGVKFYSWRLSVVAELNLLPSSTISFSCASRLLWPPSDWHIFFQATRYVFRTI